MSLNADDVSGPEPEVDYTEEEQPLDPTAGNIFYFTGSFTFGSPLNNLFTDENMKTKNI